MKEQQRVKIASYLESCVVDGVFPGANVVVYEQEVPTYFCVGNKRLVPYVEANSLDTMYDLASLTKVISTTNLILMAIEEGKLALTTTIASILPDYQQATITIQDVLTHTSGLPADVALCLNDTKNSIRKAIASCQLSYPTGSDVVYSDIGFITLGFILEAIYQEPLQDIARKKIFEPLQMMDTMYCPTPLLQSRCAPTEDSPHFHKLICGEVHDRKAHLMKGVAGHAGVFSTIHDMEHMVEMLLHNGVYQGKQVLSEASIASFSKVSTPSGALKRSLGYLCKDENSPFAEVNSPSAYMHTGFAGTSILIDPQLRLAIVILSNRIHPSRDNTLILSARAQIHNNIVNALMKCE